MCCFLHRLGTMGRRECLPLGWKGKTWTSAWVPAMTGFLLRLPQLWQQQLGLLGDRLGCFQANASLTTGPLTRSPETWLLGIAWPPTLLFLFSLSQLVLLSQKDPGSGLPKTLLLVRMCLSFIPEV